MPNDAQNTLAAFLAKGSASFRRANAHLLLPVPSDRPRPPAQPERAAKKRIPRERPNKKADPRRYFVRFESVRNVLLDEDNLISKWHCDALRYAGILHSDAPGACSIRTTQRKTQPGEPEHVVIEIQLIA